MELMEIMEELKSLGNERTKKMYMSNGAQEPVFGVSISAMKPIFKKIKYNQPLAEELYSTGSSIFLYDFGLHRGCNPCRNGYCLCRCGPLD